MRALLILTSAAVLAFAGTAPAQTADVVEELAHEGSWTDAGPIWGGHIKSQAEMLPYFHFRIDDWGSRSSDMADMAIYAIKLGLDTTLAINALNASDLADSLAMVRLITALDETGRYDSIQWINHMNTNGSTTNGTSETIGDWTDFYEYTWDRWLDEFSKQPILNVVNNAARDLGSPYRITADDIKGILWPGDNNPDRRQFVRSNPVLIQRIMDHLGYEYAITSRYGSSEEEAYTTGIINSTAAPLASGFLFPFCMSDRYEARHYLSFSSTFDLGNGVVERGTTAKVPWAPASTVEWTLATKTNYHDVTLTGSGTAPIDDYREATTSNYLKTLRSLYEIGLMHGGGFGIVMHSEPSSEEAGTTYDFAFPCGGISGNGCDGSAGPNTNLQIGDSVNGGAGTFDDPLDYRYTLSLLAQLVKNGFARSGTIDEHMRWLASKPAAPGLIVSGWDTPVRVAQAIGDTVGIETPLIRGAGSWATLSNDYLSMGPLRHVDQNENFAIFDIARDGKIESFTPSVDTGWDDVTQPTEKAAIINNYGDRGPGDDGSLFLFDVSGWGPNYGVGVSELVPGSYRLEIVISSAEAWRWTTAPTLYLYGQGHENTSGSYGSLNTSLVTYTEEVLAPGSPTDFDLQVANQTGGGTAGATDFGGENWPGGTPTRPTLMGFYTIVLPFRVHEVPLVDTNFDPGTDVLDATISHFRGAFHANLALLSEDRSGGYGLEESAKIHSVFVRWMGR